jgi:uncharacterized protein (TIGR04222 family)
MNHDEALIRARLERHEFDEPHAIDTFARRLARENDWSERQARRVIGEYRRFLLLAAVAPHPVSPSDAVDQAWHVHVLDSKAYRAFCRNVLGRRLDHVPSRGGAEERAKHQRDYEATLDTYRQMFGEEPPPDLWPSPAQRFGHGFVRLERSAHWVVPKPSWWQAIDRRTRGSFGVHPETLVFLVAVAFAGYATTGGIALALSGPAFLFVLVIGWLASLLVANALLRGDGSMPPADAESAPELDAYETAYLVGQGPLAVDAATAVLVARGEASFDQSTGTLRAAGATAAGAHPFEAGIRAALEREETRLGIFRAAAEAISGALRERLVALRLLAPERSWTPFLIALAAPLAAAVRLVSRLGSGLPLGGLIVACVVGVIVAFAFFRPRVRTARGEALLASLRKQHAGLPAAPSGELLANGALPLAIGLFGVGAVVPVGELTDLSAWHARARSGGQQPGGCGAGCSGGGDGGDGGGGGCGGCGGCGGGCGGGE